MTHTLTLRRREDGRESAVLDVTGMSTREFERLWDGLVMKIDFEIWEPVYSPPRRDDQTAEEWLTDQSAAATTERERTHE